MQQTINIEYLKEKFGTLETIVDGVTVEFSLFGRYLATRLKDLQADVDTISPVGLKKVIDDGLKVLKNDDDPSKT